MAVIICGSIAHGFATEASDIDVMLVVSNESFKSRLANGTIQFLNKEYHVDGKYISTDFIKNVIEKGNEAAKYCFDGAFVAYSKIDGLEELIEKAQQYPKEQKQDKINRFYGQFKAWNYYCKDSIKKQNEYLINLSVSNLIFYGARLILAYNEKLYPYQKWVLRVLEGCENKPEDLMQHIDNLLKSKTLENVERLHKAIDEFSNWNTTGRSWPNIFLYDSEWNWMFGEPPVADL